MPDQYSGDCPKPEEDDSHHAQAPSGKGGIPEQDPDSAASAMKGYDPGTPFGHYLDREMALQTEPAPGKT